MEGRSLKTRNEIKPFSAAAAAADAVAATWQHGGWLQEINIIAISAALTNKRRKYTKKRGREKETPTCSRS